MRTAPFALALLLTALPAGASAVEAGAAAPMCPALAAADIRAHTAGKIVIVDFWASWCAPCRKLMPLLDTLHAAHAADGLTVVAVNVDEQRADAERFLARLPVRYPVVFDPEGVCPTAFDLAGMPSTYLIDRAGIVRYAHAGFRTPDGPRLQAALRELLNE